MRNSLKFILSVSISLMFVQYVAAQAYDMKLNLGKGQKYDMSLTTKEEITQSATGLAIAGSMSNKSGILIAHEVNSIDKDSNYVIEAFYKRVTIETNNLSATLRYDSKEKSNSKKNHCPEQLAKVIDSLIGKKYFLTLSPRGKVIKLEGYKEIIDKLSKDASPNVVMTLTSIFNENKLIANYSSAYSILPEYAVRKGDKWKSKATQETMAPLNSEDEYELKDINRKTATISMTAGTSMKTAEDPSKKTDFTGTQNGQYKVDVATGLDIKGSIITVVKGAYPASFDRKYTTEISTTLIK